jgi:hypothetical protein
VRLFCLPARLPGGAALRSLLHSVGTRAARGGLSASLRALLVLSASLRALLVGRRLSRLTARGRLLASLPALLLRALLIGGLLLRAALAGGGGLCALLHVHFEGRDGLAVDLAGRLEAL